MASPTDDQIPIPPALLRLLADLEALPPSIPILQVDLTRDEFGGVFTSLEGSYRRQVRLRVLTAIGSCRSLQVIHLNPHNKIGVFRVTVAEATALFQGLQSSPVLYWLDVSGWRGFGTAAACEALAVLVRSSRTLKALTLQDTGLTGEGLGHIAAALQANTSSILQSLHVSWNRIGDAAGAQHLADILASTPTLKGLGMLGISMDAAGGEVIAKALAHNTSLRWLEMGWHALGWVVHAANRTNQSATLTRILAALSGPVGAGAPHAANRTNQSSALTRILAALSGPVGAGAPHASAFNTHIKMLKLTMWVWRNDLEPIEAGVGEGVAHMLRSNATLQELHISTSFVGYGLEALRYNTSITELKVVHDPSRTKVDLDKLIPIIRSCQTLQRLQYCNDNLPPEFKKQVFRSLKDNPFIKTLVIDGWEGLDDDMFKDVMESLQVNTNLEAISLERTSWKLDGKEATIKRALRRNKLLKRRVAYLDLLHHGDMELTSPKAGRLFLCGFGFAGKTTLRKSMICSWSKLQRSDSMPSFVTNLSLAKSRRTQGIEIQMLRDDSTMQISIWDLAGQDKFRALQSFLFPSISQACVFLFVFSCYDRDTKELKPEKSLDEELRHWMRFIASNSSSQGHVLPQVFVILSHLDKMPRGTTDTMVVEWAKPTITRVGKDFAGLLNISSQVFALKSSSIDSVTSVLETVFQLFEDLLFKKLKVVPRPCTRMSTVLGQWRSRNPARPMMPLQEFHDLCFKEVPELGKFGKHDETANQILEAIASYLHDVGTRCHVFQESENCGCGSQLGESRLSKKFDRC